MHVVVVRVASSADFSASMIEMRTWLDEHRCEPSRFKCGRDRAAVVIYVNVTKDGEAAAFKRRFGN